MKMNDIVELIGEGSIIQHGKLNDRIYLMKFDERDVEGIIDKLSALAEENKYTKLFCKIPKKFAPIFLAEGYMMEAYIPKFYKNTEEVFFLSKYLSADRLLSIEKSQLSNFAKLLSQKPQIKKTKASDFTVRKLNDSDIAQITAIYREVFESYPFPIHDPNYIRQTMNDNIFYFGAEIEGRLVAVSSTEIDFKEQNVEMTDFATLTDYAGNSLATMLLNIMEVEMRNQGIKTLYTIARLNSIPMNLTFLRSNYQYSGTLLNNTNIAGNIESMNVYFKHI